MASIKAILKINEDGNGVIERVTTNVETNNISILPYTTDITNWFVNQTEANKKYQGATPNNIVGKSLYGTARYGLTRTSDGKIVSLYNGLMYPTPNQLSNDLAITIVGTNILAFNIHFDNTMGQYPTEYTVYSSLSGTTTTYSSSDNVIEISDLLTGYGTTIITFTQWAENDVPIGITFIENQEINLDMDKYWIDSFETQSQKLTDASSVNYEALANTGNITLIDKKNKLYEYSRLGYLDMNIFVLSLYINEREAQRHISLSNPSYSSNHTMKLELTNDIQKWNDILIPETIYSSSLRLNTLFHDLLETYLGYTNDEVNAILNESKVKYISAYGNEVEDTVNNYFSMVIRYNNGITIQSGSLLEQLNKICKVSQTSIYLGDDNSFKIRSSRPIKISNEKIINVPFNKQYSTFEFSIITDNRYDGVAFENDTTSISGNNVLKLQSNEFIDNATFSSTGTTMKSKISQQILKDYSKGVRNATLKIFPSDYYYTDGTLAKNWKLGEIVEINDIIKIEKIEIDEDGNNIITNVLYDSNGNEVYFRITDRKVIYEGQILIELSLQEIIN